MENTKKKDVRRGLLSLGGKKVHVKKRQRCNNWGQPQLSDKAQKKMKRRNKTGREERGMTGRISMGKKCW